MAAVIWDKMGKTRNKKRTNRRRRRRGREEERMREGRGGRLNNIKIALVCNYVEQIVIAKCND